MTRIAILISGRGSNCMAIIQAVRDGRLPNCEVAVVISNIPGAPGIEAARALGVEAVTLEGRGRPRAEHEEAVLALLQKFRVDLVCLAGYMRLLSPNFVRQFPNRLLNIHPSLLPAFPGLHPQRQALDYGATVTGCSVHFVDESVDGGVLILQRTVEIQPEDTEDTLSDRILTEEHKAYVEAINRVLSGTYEIQNRRYLPRQSTTA
ncbi:MAG: phosphoribosylglycinamide formyltransferase [Acidobacteriota bacterium]